MIKLSKIRIAECLLSVILRAKGFENKFRRKDRGLGAERTLGVILSRLYKPLQLEIDDYFKEIGGSPVTRQALSKSRAFLNPEYVRGFFDDCVKAIVDEDDKYLTYRNMRIIAIDGSTLALENSAELIEKFGCSGKDKDSATARCSIAFDPLNKVIYDGQIGEYEGKNTGERNLAKRHIKRLNELKLQGSLLLFDRGYPSCEFIKYLIDNGYHFVMRVKEKWNLEVDAVETQDRFEITYGDKKYGFRAIKITLDNGTAETLLTSLNQKQLPASSAAEIYFKRWAVEGAYDLLKSRLQLENFSGKTEKTVLQDFWATLYIGNFVAAVSDCADKIIHENDEGKNLKNERFADRGRVVDKFRGVFIDLLLCSDENGIEKMVEDLILDCSKYPIPKVDGRSAQRKPPRKRRFHSNRKNVV
jgi:hypothetical protein